MDVFRVESLLHRFEYQADMDVAWLRAEPDIEEALDAIE
jgi:hypothetical protein